MMETIDTRGQFDMSIPDGERDFRIDNIDRKEKGKAVFYVWRLYFKENGEDQFGEQVLFANEMGDLLEILGCKKIADKKYEWDRQLLQGQTFRATVSQVPDKKDPQKMRQKMDGFKKAQETFDDIPF